ncbi:unnamed protein product, partial [Urochloa humidicola]
WRCGHGPARAELTLGEVVSCVRCAAGVEEDAAGHGGNLQLLKRTTGQQEKGW